MAPPPRMALHRLYRTAAARHDGSSSQLNHYGAIRVCNGFSEEPLMNRREFLGSSFAMGGAALAASPAFAAITGPTSQRRFSLNYAPHFGMFRNRGGEELIDQIRFMAD